MVVIIDSVALLFLVVGIEHYLLEQGEYMDEAMKINLTQAVEIAHEALNIDS